MDMEQFEAALTALGWKGSDFCRMAGVHRNTPSRWRNGETDIPAWVERYLGITLEIQRLHAAFVVPRGTDVAEPDV